MLKREHYRLVEKGTLRGTMRSIGLEKADPSLILGTTEAMFITDKAKGITVEMLLILTTPKETTKELLSGKGAIQEASIISQADRFMGILTIPSIVLINKIKGIDD